MREIIFIVVAVGILGVLIWLSQKSTQKRFPTMFAMALFCFLAFYLFQYGNLSSFSLKALSAEASFIREKKQEVTQDAEAIGAIRKEVEAAKKEMAEANNANRVQVIKFSKLIETNTFALQAGYGITIDVVGTNVIHRISDAFSNRLYVVETGKLDIATAATTYVPTNTAEFFRTNLNMTIIGRTTYVDAVVTRE